MFLQGCTSRQTHGAIRRRTNPAQAPTNNNATVDGSGTFITRLSMAINTGALAALKPAKVNWVNGVGLEKLSTPT